MKRRRTTSSHPPESLARVTAALREARLAAGLSLRELANRAGTSHATLLAYERGVKVPSVATWLRLLEACDCAVDVELERRVRERNGLDRGEELYEVLMLAEQFPARPRGRSLRYPKLSAR